MPHYLSKLVKKYDARVGRLYAQAAYLLEEKNKHERWRERFVIQSLISEAWQDWSNFCRELILASCQGCRTTDGILILPRSGDNSWGVVSYTFKHLKQTPGKKLLHKWQEPTWGDVSKMLDGINATAPNNAKILSAAFGIPTLTEGIDHMQKLRNCLAHKNEETVAVVKGLYPFYTMPVAPIEPYELIWLATKSSHIAFMKWLSDIRTIIYLATKGV